MTSAISHQDLSDLIGRIYDCTLDPSRWEPTLDAIRTLLASKTAQLALVDLRESRVLIQKTLGMESDLIEAVSKHMRETTEFIEVHLDNVLSMAEPLLISRLASPEYRASSSYLQTSLSFGFVDMGQITIMRSPERLSGLGFGRHESVGVFGDREIEVMRLLIPHVRRAVTISNVLD